MLADLVQTYVIPIALRILLAVLAWIVGRWLARRTRVWLTSSLERTELTESFVVLITTVAYYGVLVLTAMVALAALGVPVTILGAALGIIVVVLAISLQQQLGNLASTVIIMLFKPFEVGQVIETSGAVGAVQEIQMLSTVLASSDGKTHVVPNSSIQASGLTNYTTAGRLLVKLAYTVANGADVDKAKEVLLGIVTADERVLADPAPRAFVQQLADNGVEVAAQGFTEPGVQSSVQTELVERVKAEFEAAGIAIPHPQQDVNLLSSV